MPLLLAIVVSGCWMGATKAEDSYRLYLSLNAKGELVIGPDKPALKTEAAVRKHIEGKFREAKALAEARKEKEIHTTVIIRAESLTPFDAVFRFWSWPRRPASSTSSSGSRNNDGN
jgi:hypothetical protein